MKLNNKGFAITAVLYGILILFVLMVSSYLMILSSRKNKLDSIVKEIEKNYFDSSSETIEEGTGAGEETPGSDEDPSAIEESRKYTVKIYYVYDNDQEVEVTTKEVDNGGSTGQITVSCDHTYATYENTICENNENISISNFDAKKFVQNMQDKVYLTINNVNSDTECTVYFEA